MAFGFGRCLIAAVPIKQSHIFSSLRHHANTINICLTTDSECERVCHCFVGYMVILQKAGRGVLADLSGVIKSLLTELGTIC